MFTRLKAWYSGKRIIETGGVFIPQIRPTGSDWAGIMRIDHSIRIDMTGQLIFCQFDTYEEANERLLEYFDEEERSKIKVHAITKEPKAWRLLKNKSGKENV